MSRIRSASEKRGPGYLLIRYKVASFRKWKDVFDAQAATRKASGCSSGRLYRNAGDPRELVILLRCEDIETAHGFVEAEDFREALARAGVSDVPDVFFLEDLGGVRS